MDLATCINQNLVTRTDAETGIVAGSEMHETFARSRVGLLIESAGNRKATANVRLQAGHGFQVGRLDVDSGSFSSRGNVGTGGGRDAVLDIRPGDGVGVERLDIEDERDDVHVQPETRAEIWALDMTRVNDAIDWMIVKTTYLLEQGQSDTSAKEFAEMGDAELAQGLENVLLDLFGIFLGVVGVVRDHGRCEIGAVDGVVDGNRDLVLGVVVGHAASDGSPHRLDRWGNERGIAG